MTESKWTEGAEGSTDPDSPNVICIMRNWSVYGCEHVSVGWKYQTRRVTDQIVEIKGIGPGGFPRRWFKTEEEFYVPQKALAKEP